MKWKKQKSQTDGYEIQYSTNSRFKGAKTLRYIYRHISSQNISSLKARKKYYVRIRTYKYAYLNNQYTKLCSGWSKSKSVKTKK